jgi:hypothetical protein
VVLEPNVERDNDFINLRGMMLVLLEQREEKEENKKIYILHFSTSSSHKRQLMA